MFLSLAHGVSDEHYAKFSIMFVYQKQSTKMTIT